MKKTALALMGVFFLSGCNDSQDVMAARMTGAVAGGMLGSAFSDNNGGAVIAGAIVGSALAGEVAKDQEARRIEYHDVGAILDHGRTGVRYTLSTHGERVSVVPGPFVDVHYSGSLLTCRMLRWSEGSAVSSNRYCLMENGWRPF